MSADDSHHQDDERASYAKVVKDGDGTMKHGQFDGVPGMLTPHSHAEHSHKRTHTRSEVSLDMASGTPVTLARRAGQSAVHSGFPYPSIPRALFAPDPAHGPQADAKAKAAWCHDVSDADARRAWENRSVLEKHCAFFDRDGDGVVWPHDTFVALYALGFGLLLSAAATVAIHSAFAWRSQGRPDPLFRFYVHNVDRCKHGSNSGTYDAEGRFTPQKFDDIFAKYSSDPARGYLTVPDTVRLLSGFRLIMDPFGWLAAIIEWVGLWYVVWPKDRRLKREDVRAAYTGELFYRIAHERKKGKKGHAQTNGAAHSKD